MYHYTVTRQNEPPVIVGPFPSKELALAHMFHSFKHELMETEIVYDGVTGIQNQLSAVILGIDDDDGVYIIAKYEYQEEKQLGLSIQNHNHNEAAQCKKLVD